MQNKQQSQDSDGDKAMIIPQEMIDQSLSSQEVLNDDNNARIIAPEIVDKARRLQEEYDFENAVTQPIDIGEFRAKQRQKVQEALKKRRNSELREYDEVQRETDVSYIPDIHGDLQALKNSLMALGLIDENDKWKGEKSVVVFSGDYIDRGEQNLEVLDFVWKLKQEAEIRGGGVELLLGNHETFMLGGLLGDERFFYSWLLQGGLNVLINVASEYNYETEKDWLLHLKEYVDDFKNLDPKHKVEIITYIKNTVKEFRSTKELHKMFFKSNGRYSEMLKKTKVFSQIDDVLYVHAGINLKWSEKLRAEGVDSLNSSWNTALDEAKNGDFKNFHEFNEIGGDRGGNISVGGPFWADFDRELEMLSDEDIAQIAQNLKAIGINVIVVGHSKREIPVMSEKFNRHGIKLICCDVGSSSAYTKGESGRGGAKTDTKGNIQAYSKDAVHDIYKNPKEARKEAEANKEAEARKAAELNKVQQSMLSSVKIEVDDLVRLVIDKKVNENWRIMEIDGNQVLLAKEIDGVLHRINTNLDTVKRYNPQGGKK